MSTNNMAHRICFEDNHLCLVYKNSGEPVQGDSSGDMALVDTFKNYIKQRDAKPGAVFCGLVHRIDRPVSGVLILAKTSKALSRLSQAFQKREVIKEYLAIVPRRDIPETQLLCHYLIRNTKQNKSYVVDSNQNGAQRAELEYNIMVKWDHYMLLQIKLFTGRHHQIRAQLAHIGIPIKGDLKYGAQRSNPDGNILLHSYHIKFKHPVKDEWISHYALPREANPSWDLTRLYFLNSKPNTSDKPNYY